MKGVSILLATLGLAALFSGSSAGVAELSRFSGIDGEFKMPVAPVMVYESEGMADEVAYESEGMADEVAYESKGMADEAPYEHAEMADVVYEHEAMADEVAPYEHVAMADEIYEHESMADEVGPQSRANECQVTIRGGITDPQPVYLQTDSESFYPFNEKGVMQFNAGSTFQMYCAKQFTKFSATLLTATCVSGTNFKVDGTTYSFNEFVCNSWPEFKVEKTGKTCNGGILLRVGFVISSTRFAEQMQVCFNEEEEVTRYVRHTLEPGSDYYQTGVDRITFQTQGFFGGKNVDKLYTQATQKETINKALGYDVSAQYFDTSTVFLARGHMGAKADFNYGTQQRGTFVFVNVAPEWQCINAGNWARIEDGLRTYVSKNNKNVNCYTGVNGVTTLPNSNGVETELYLSYDSNNKGLIPVPKIYFRVVIEPATNKGIVFVSVNNPHLSLAQIQKDYILCNDVSSQVTYINWKKEDIKAGYSYACEVAEFLKAVPNLPALTAKGGLLL